ncbi:hypothetical protein [Malonomonas rubra]|nr:hypothetical protein [Malonomonas rubra]
MMKIEQKLLEFKLAMALSQGVYHEIIRQLAAWRERLVMVPMA